MPRRRSMRMGVRVIMRMREKVGFVYHHTCDRVPVPLMNEVRVGHTNVMTRGRWVQVSGGSADEDGEI